MRPRLAGRFSCLALVILVAMILLLSASRTEAAQYSFSLISDQMSSGSYGYLAYSTKLNNRGHLVWEESAFPNYSLWLYRGGTKTAIPCDNTVGHGNLDMNDHDQVVWTQEYYVTPSLHYSDVYYYSDGSTVQVTHAAEDHINHFTPRINNLGTIMWYEWLGDHGRIVLQKGGGVVYQTATINGIPQLNDRDEVVWSGNSGTGNLQIYYWHGDTVDVITSDANENKQPVINNQGVIVYAKTAVTGYDLYLYRDEETAKIGSGVSGWLPYKINDQGQVAWVAEPGYLYLFSGGSNTPIGAADYSKLPGLNNQGQVAYQGNYGGLRLYDQRTGANVELLSIDNRFDVQLNDAGQIAWHQPAGDLSHDLLYLGSPIATMPPVNLLLLD